MDNMTEKLTEINDISILNNPDAEEKEGEDMTGQTEGEISASSIEDIGWSLSSAEPLKKEHPRIQKFLKKMYLKAGICVMIFLALFFALRLDADWVSNVKNAVSYVLNQQIDLAVWKENTLDMMELFYEKLFAGDGE